MPDSPVITIEFKRRFNEISQMNVEIITNKLLSLFDTSPSHFSRSTMHRYYFKYPHIRFDKDVASEILLHFFDGRSFYFKDFSNKELNRPNVFASLKTANDGHEMESLQNWIRFLEDIQQRYWEEADLSVLDKTVFFYEDRPPKNLREKMLSSGMQMEVEGKVVEIRYSFFNIKNVLKYYEALFALHYAEYPLVKELSTKKIKRYAKYVGNDIYLGFSVDYSFLERELKMTYLELPTLKVEIFFKGLTSPISEENIYLNSQTDSLIARIDLFYFMGHFVDNRVGNSSQSSVLLQKKLIFQFEVSSFYMKIYLDSIADILLKM